ncbi:MAG: hypothetical protein CVT90_00570 [Candidatus Altiarchaeales archaeon HGW-Altiarchaeales-3]|nr:MAG: hypothetical protein CVT90_00570 [Candidatus Altiarchaeales archaeon HGW-Altiarchaeales-3]
MKYMQINNSNKGVILELFGKSLDDDGFIIEKKNKIRLICPYSKEHIRGNNFSILPGTATFVNNKPYCFAEHIVSHSK